MGDAQRLLRIGEEALLKDQKIALLKQRGYNFRFTISDWRLEIPHSAIRNRQSRGLPDRLSERNGTHRPRLEAGRSWGTEVELEATMVSRLGRFCFRRRHCEKKMLALHQQFKESFCRHPPPQANDDI